MEGRTAKLMKCLTTNNIDKSNIYEQNQLAMKKEKECKWNKIGKCESLI